MAKLTSEWIFQYIFNSITSLTRSIFVSLVTLSLITVLSFFHMHWGSKMDWMRHSMTTFLVLVIVTTRGTSLITGITVKNQNKCYLSIHSLHRWHFFFF